MYSTLRPLLFALDPETVAEARAAALPVAGVEFLERERPAGPLFNSYNWGGYLIWQARDYPVYVDGRTDLYDDALLRVYLSLYFATGDEWSATLDEEGINLVMVEPRAPLARVLALSPAWARIYADEQTVIYSRNADT